MGQLSKRCLDQDQPVGSDHDQDLGDSGLSRGGMSVVGPRSSQYPSTAGRDKESRDPTTTMTRRLRIGITNMLKMCIKKMIHKLLK